jgi:hypothetical protein
MIPLGLGKGFSPPDFTTSRNILLCPGYQKTAAKNHPLFPYGYNYGGVSDCLGPGRVGKRDCGLGQAGQLLSERVVGPSDIRPISESSVLSPSQMICLGDSILGDFGGFTNNAEIGGGPDISIGTFNIAEGVYMGEPRAAKGNAARHLNEWNLVYCDGHVNAKKEKGLFDMQNASVRRMWNKDNEAHFEFTSPYLGN